MVPEGIKPIVQARRFKNLQFMILHRIDIQKKTSEKLTA